METEDEQLAAAAREGDRNAFAMLLERHYDRMFALGYRLTGNRIDAEDLIQDICLSLPAKIASWRGDAKFTTWLYRVVVNACHDWRRKAVNRSKVAKGWGEVEVARRAESVEAAERMVWLSRAMATLPPDLRDTVALTIDGDMTQSDAALVLGVAEGTVAWRMSEVRKYLRQLAVEEDIG